MAASEENKFPPSFLGFKSQEQTTMNSRLTSQQVSFIFGCSKRSPDFKTAVYFLQGRALIIEDEFKNTYLG